MRSCIQTPFTYICFFFFFFVRKTSDMSVAHSCVLDQLSRTSCRSLSVCPARRSRIGEPVKRLKQKGKKNKKKTNGERPLFVTYTSCTIDANEKNEQKEKKKKNGKIREKKPLKAKS
ncbi:hypothetical protein K0M31_012218 [Melipona bicolor]|uniref:Secreted protein n=1 Tax=Melipona bicolor TaxID=60889 RepID=A0AA40FK56_9HYME|nr:hypothetical protein K0M31_012218 [Melipona bicolor]